MSQQRCILMTGASSGIGKSICDQLLQGGHQVIGLSRHPVRQEPHENHTPVSFDLRNLAELPATLKTILEQHPQVDGVISNAGTPAMGGLEQWSATALNDAIQMNLTSHMALARYVMPHLRQKNTSDLIFMASEASHATSKNGAVYCAAKFGLRGFAQVLRQEGASSGVRVSTVMPGFVRTPFFDDLNFEPGEERDNAITPESIAETVCHILSAPANVVFDEVRVSPLKKVLVRKKPSGDA
ncbi:MAG: short-chain dehydrogenase [Myxococcales bacterium]|nr:short-chain dehydrogenase [Myxococcales bacterium]